VANRRQYIEGHTWAVRARQLVRELMDIPKLAGCGVVIS
jgi:hypothetical protein